MVWVTAAIFAVLLGAAAFAASDGGASVLGAWDKRAHGCWCHSAVATTSMVISVTGFPAQWELGAQYAVTVRLVSQALGNASERRAGFNAEVSQGTLHVPSDALEAVQSVGAQVTHMPAGTNQTAWNFTWRAPAEPAGVVVLWVTVNSVNGDTVPGQGDGWAQVVLESLGPAPPKGDGGGGGVFGPITDPASGAWPLIGAAAAGGAAVALFVVWRLKHAEGRKPVKKKRHRAGRKAASRRGPPAKRRHRGL